MKHELQNALDRFNDPSIPNEDFGTITVPADAAYFLTDWYDDEGHMYASEMPYFGLFAEEFDCD